MSKINKFKIFLDKFRDSNKLLVESIENGFNAIFESTNTFSYGDTPVDVFQERFIDVMGSDFAKYNINPGNSTFMNKLMSNNDVLKGVKATDNPRGGMDLDMNNLWRLLDNLYNVSSDLQMDPNDFTLDEQDSALSVRTDILSTLGIEEI